MPDLSDLSNAQAMEIEDRIYQSRLDREFEQDTERNNRDDWRLK